MRTTTRILLFVLLFSSAVAGGAWALAPVAAVHIDPSGRPTTDLGFFFDDLAPYGTWLQSPANGWVWTPSAVAPTWHPYELGHWSLTDQGWMWMSDEPFGWATYHYGRWYDDPDIGWAWVPGNEWAPSWVSFQESPSYVGWAPLPPAVDLRARAPRFALAPDTFLFVPKRSFLAPRVVDFVVPPARALPIFRTTRNVTQYRFVGDRVFTYGVPVQRLRPVIGRPIPLYRLADIGPAPRLRPARIMGDRIAVFRPQVVRKLRVAPPPLRLGARNAVISRTEFRNVRAQRVVVNGPGVGSPRSGPVLHVRTVKGPPDKVLRRSQLRPAPGMKARGPVPHPQRMHGEVHGRDHGPRARPAQRTHFNKAGGARIQHGKAGARVQHGQASRMRMPGGAARRQHAQAGPRRQAGPRGHGGPGGHGGGKRRP